MKSLVNSRKPAAPMGHRYWIVLVVLMLLTVRAGAAQLTIYTNDFESYSNVATNLADDNDADPTGPDWNIVDDASLHAPTTAGAGVQVINWLARSGSKSLLLKSSSEAQIYLPNTKSGTNYTLDFWTHAVRGAGDRNWYVIVRGMGADNNGDDYFAYRTDRSVNSNIFYYDGIGAGNNFIDTGVDHVDNQWQHHRIIFNTAAQTCSIFIDDMVTPAVVNGQFARVDVAVPSMIRLVHEGNSANDGYAAIDDISFTVDGALIDLNTTFTEGFESYPARVDVNDDADPQGPWITVESVGSGNGRELAPTKVQVVDSSVITPHSGSKSLKLEGGMRGGASVAWGIPPQSDVQITWWARVPEVIQSATTLDAVVLRMSLYGVEGGNSFSGDSALLAHGIRRQGNTNEGDSLSLLYFAGRWRDTGIDFAPDVWEQYRLTTHNSQGTYTIIKNPSSATPTLIVDRAALVGSAANWGPDFIAAWSSSNGDGHPPVYIDDIEIKSLVSNPAPLGEPYSITNYGTRFTNFTILSVPGLVGKPVVDPRDNTTILFNVDAAAGGIYQAKKVSNGNWTVDPTPIVSNLDRPSGLTIETNGTIWWTHDFTMALVRLKSPWTSNVPETIISNFGPAATDDDPIDVTVAPANFSGSLAQPGNILVADRGADGDANNAVYVVDQNTTSLDQTGYSTYLINPTGGGLGDNLNAITPIPASGEVATLSQDGFLIGIDANGAQRFINAFNLWPLGGAAAGVAIATDPIGGKIWAADDLLDEVWSIDAASGADQREIEFTLIDPLRPDRQIDFHDPGMSFAPNGAFLVLADSNPGAGRLIIFHNEVPAPPSFAITNAVRVGQNFQINWQPAGSSTYTVQRGTTVTNLQNIATGLTTTEYLDTNAPAGTAFYRVIATP